MPSPGAYESGGQASQAVPSSFEVVPARQILQLSDPGSSLKVPGGQSTHWTALIAKVPGAQSVQLLLCAEEMAPIGQPIQADARKSLEYVPASQGRQALPSLEYVPGTHSRHSVSEVEGSMPAGHVAQSTG